MAESPDLQLYLAACTLLDSHTIMWPGQLQLQVRTYLADIPPPIAYVSSVRCVLFRGDAVLVERAIEGPQILPGGRREQGETLEQTLRREVVEETGWVIDGPRLLGCLHFHHLNPKPARYVYPYPDFMQPIFIANAVSYVSDRRVHDEHVTASGFVPLAEVTAMALPGGQRELLIAALRWVGQSTGCGRQIRAE
jgi:8-oxo-dGTP pyrophosphatase MutT (NUDIX family)